MTTPADSPPRVIRLIIRGRVQGVWFRAWTVETAGRLGLNGWVRNRADGAVEAAAAGPADPIESFIAACHDGPLLAEVSVVEVSDASSAELPEPLPDSGFVQKPTV